MRYTRLGAEQIVNRAVTESRSANSDADVISMRGTFIPELPEKKIIVRYKSPMTAFCVGVSRIRKVSWRRPLRPVMR